MEEIMDSRGRRRNNNSKVIQDIKDTSVFPFL